MLLTDHEIAALVRQAIEEGDPPLLDPFVGHKVTGSFPSYGLHSAGYDIRFNPGVEYTLVHAASLAGSPYPFITPHNSELQKRTYHYHTPRNGYVVIPPMTLALGTSLEKFDMPSNVVATCHGKSTYSRLGVILNVTPIDPGWRGYLTIEMFNHNPNPIGIPVEGGVLTVQFHLLDSEPQHTYHGNYQDQCGKVTPATVLRK